MHRLILSALGPVFLAIPAVAQTALTCPAADIPCRVQHDDAVALGTKLDLIRGDLQALSKGAQNNIPSSADNSAHTTPNSTMAPPIDKYFPKNAGDAEFPSPENSRMVRLNGVVSGKPYLISSDGSVHQLVTPTAAIPNGYAVNGSHAGGGGSDEQFSQLIVRQGKVFVQRSTGQWQAFNPGMNSIYNASLPDPFATDSSGATTSTVATSSVKAPVRAARAKVAPGSSGKILKVCATGCAYSSLTAAITRAVNGDTINIGAGIYKEAPPAIAATLKIVWEAGAVLDLSGLTNRLAHGKGAIVPMADILLVNPVITGTAMDQGSAQGTAAIRPETGCNYIEIQGGELFKNQNGIAGGDVPVVLTVTGTYLHDNGLGDGYTHNIYMSSGTIAVSLIDVRSINPNNGHALKSRAFDTSITRGEYEAFSAAPIDIPQGSVSPALLDGVSIMKKAGAYNHAILDYATENNASGNGGLIVKNSTLTLNCDNPFFNVGASAIVTLDPNTQLTGNKPTVTGGGKVVGL